MSNIKIIKTSSDLFAMMIRRYIIPETGVYDTMKSNSSIVDDPFSQLSWIWNIFLDKVFLFLVVVMNIEMVHWMWWFFPFFIIYKYLFMPLGYKGAHDYTTNVIFCWRICRKDNNFSLLIEFILFDWRGIFFLNIYILKILVSTGCNNVNPNPPPCELMTWDGFNDFC